MLNDKIETAEIADAELDQVSGGVGVAAEGVVGVAGTELGGGVSAGVDGLGLDALPVPGLDGVTGTVSGLTGGLV
ncbi:type A2 lantipeptide [Streptomyces sp. RKND-216]|uniref:Type A2 lantipeptide n=1 Tax=Streptomyces hazeniae TaxID=3075538 RepID=A0ABU2NU84_9ACTN|nr:MULTISPECIES: hypothetical protein [unclassified Streptomyces]MDT0379173.1 type A2 lantipeptide [Streptomyces sp. DSM 42041]THA27265.1 type A2 lantipeptide [Streptomyces sp. RKND-216]